MRGGTLVKSKNESSKSKKGVAQLLTFGGCGIWWLIDFIMIIVGSYRDGEGKVVSNK
ncbi:MAG: NINE protein [Alistipes sp.]|nr:NINE protein [Alistipes sp.]